MAKPKLQSRYIPNRVKDAVRERDQNRCTNCGDTSYLEFDHKTPYSKGAPNTIENLQLLCRKCNLAKGKRTPKCENCQSWIPADASFCHSCGRTIKSFISQPQSIASRTQTKSKSSLTRKLLLILAFGMILYGLQPFIYGFVKALLQFR